jgi:hypothetical protein
MTETKRTRQANQLCGDFRALLEMMGTPRIAMAIRSISRKIVS